jgi:hypothetical protein
MAEMASGAGGKNAEGMGMGTTTEREGKDAIRIRRTQCPLWHLCCVPLPYPCPLLLPFSPFHLAHSLVNVNNPLSGFFPAFFCATAPFPMFVLEKDAE